jgi:hypothetical protein
MSKIMISKILNDGNINNNIMAGGMTKALLSQVEVERSMR